MLFNKLAGIVLLSLTFVLAVPILEIAVLGNELEARAPPTKTTRPPTSPARKPVLYTGGGVVANARAANLARKQCKKVSDCSCPAPKPGTKISSTSCINGFCQCDNAVVNFFGGKFIDAVKAVGNAPITKAIGNLMKGLADVKQVLNTIVSQFLPGPAKLALKAALMAFPDVGPSHIDDATKKVLTGVL